MNILGTIYSKQGCFNNFATISEQSCNQGITHVKKISTILQQSFYATILQQSFYATILEQSSQKCWVGGWWPIMMSSKPKIKKLDTYSSVFTKFNNLARLLEKSCNNPTECRNVGMNSYLILVPISQKSGHMKQFLQTGVKIIGQA